MELREKGAGLYELELSDQEATDLYDDMLACGKITDSPCPIDGLPPNELDRLMVYLNLHSKSGGGEFKHILHEGSIQNMDHHFVQQRVKAPMGSVLERFKQSVSSAYQSAMQRQRQQLQGEVQWMFS